MRQPQVVDQETDTTSAVDGPFLVGELDALCELLPVAIMRIDAAGGFANANRHWYQLTGLAREEAAGQGWLQAVAPEDRARCRAWHAPEADGGGGSQAFRLCPRTGDEVIVSSRVLPLMGPSDRPIGHICSCIDITERHRHEEALRNVAHELEERLKELDCHYGISHIVEHAGGSLETVLSETAALLPESWEHADIACARITLEELTFSSPGFRVTPWHQSANILVYGERAGVVEVCYLEERPPRDEGPFLSWERRLLDDVAERLGHITERLRTEQRLQFQEQELRERFTHLSRVSTMGEMATSIAHEVNQPLTAIATYAQACRRLIERGELGGDETLGVLQRIGEEAIRAGGIIHRLKDLVRKRESRRTERDINELVGDVEQLAAVDTRLHDTQLRLELADHLPSVIADGVQLQQVILNLIRNGIDAMEETEPERREILLRTSLRDGREVEVSVTDRGCGLPVGLGEELFKPFFTTKSSGLGMGLSISRSIVSSHGGRMWYTEHGEGGTTFHFTVPVAPGAEHDT
ncbi:MAG: PAS domain S-box protein [Gemmatimonadota bacterium]|nr:MAG: PAS domain S-box protein [Gemmatimonadota bacterium]